MIITTATNKKVRELLKSVREGSLVPRPEFQRRLVWTSKDKDRFIESVIKGYPFPEIYLCNGDVDTDTGEGTQLLVDGLQRVNTLSEYFNGEGRFSHVLTVPYKELTLSEKENFLGYNVVVRDLGQINKDQIIEVFRRLNSTQYTLRDMEINNAVYDGALKKFCERIAEDPFFDSHRIFTASDRRRMGDIAFCLSLVGTMMSGYFNRDDEHERILSRFNEAFPDEDLFEARVRTVLEIIDECGFDEKSRMWKKTDFFTLFVEIDNLINVERVALDPLSTLERLVAFYASVDASSAEKPVLAEIYSKAAIQASNDRNNRLRRGLIVSGVVQGLSPDVIIEELKEKTLN